MQTGEETPRAANHKRWNREYGPAAIDSPMDNRSRHVSSRIVALFS
jgi:hypothetical protein